MFSSRRQYLDLINGLYHKGFKKNFIIARPEFWPVIKIQLGFLCHFMFGGSEIRYSSYKKFSKFSFKKFFSLCSEKISTWFLSARYKNFLKDKILLVGFTNNQSETGTNPYIHPVKKILDEAGIRNEIFLLKSNNIVEDEKTLPGFFYRLHSFYENSFYLKKNKKRSALLDKIKDEIKENFFFEKSGDIFAENSCNTIIAALIQHLNFQKAFSRFLKITNPRVIWTYCFYDNRILSLNAAANKLKIPVIEYQHSAQGNDHFAYSKWENADAIRDYFPSCFWVWRKSDAARIAKNFYGTAFRPKIIIGGNIFLSLEKTNPGQLEKHAGKAKSILVTLQGMWVPSFVEEAVEKFPEFTWYFRLHPRHPQDKLKLEQLKLKFPGRIEIEKANELSLYRLFQKVRFNLTSFSGTALEAHAFGVANIIFSEEGKSAYQDMIDNNAFLYVSNFSELEGILSNDYLQVNFEYDQMETDIQNVKKYVFEVTGTYTDDRANNN
jgi:hypothetical protein